MSMILNKYTNNVETNNIQFPLREEYSNDIILFNPQTSDEFRQISMRENAVCIVLFGNSKDPRTHQILTILQPLCQSFNRKLINIDVAHLPDLGIMYNIDNIKVMKFSKCRILEIFEDCFSSEALSNFIHRKPHIRWRQTEIR